jgi:hypothetical protein
MAECIRQTENWSVYEPYHKLDNASFDAKRLQEELDVVAPKMKKMIDTIDELVQEAIECNSYVTHNMEIGWDYFNKIQKTLVPIPLEDVRLDEDQYYSDNNTFWRVKEPQDIKQYYYVYQGTNGQIYVKSVKENITKEEIAEIYEQEADFFESFHTMDELEHEAIACNSYITRKMEMGWKYFNS